MIEELPVDLNFKGKETHGAAPHKERAKIGDLASVVPKTGRMLQIYCAEEAVSRANVLSLGKHPINHHPDTAREAHNLGPASELSQPNTPTRQPQPTGDLDPRTARNGRDAHSSESRGEEVL